MPRPRTRADRVIGFLPVLVFAVSSALLLHWWQALEADQTRLVRERFEAGGRRVATKISERLDAYDEILRGVAGLFAASREVTRDEFRVYVAELNLGSAYRGIQGVGYAQVIRPEALEAHVARVRAEGFPAYEVRPAGTRDPYTSIVYLEPFSGRNLRAFGYDMYSEPVRRAAMESARDRGEVATSGKVRLVQETEEDVQAGYLIYEPVYVDGVTPPTVEGRRRALRGWAYSPMRMNDAMRGILEREPLPFRVRIYDGEGTGTEELLYDSDPGRGAPAEFEYLLRLPVNQHSWTLRFTAGPDFRKAAGARSLALEFGVMTLIALLLTGLSVALVATTRSRRREGDTARSLRESEARHRATFERAPVGIFIVDGEDRFLQVNDRYCQITGYGAAELAGMKRQRVVHPDDVAIDAEAARKARSGETASATVERRGLRRDGTTFWAAVTFSPEGHAQAGSRNLIGVADDVTARHEAEARFREIAERAAAGILILQEDRLVYWNPAALEIFGLPPGSIPPTGTEAIQALVHPDDRQRVEEDRKQQLTDPDGMAPFLSYRIVRRDGAIRNVERLVRTIQHGGRPATLMTLIDVSERERTAEELRKAQRLESLGLVAGGIAHDFNNLLTGVFGQVEEARGMLPTGSPAARELDVALSALSRTRDLTRQLLTFATGGAPSRKALAVPRLLEEAATLALGGSALRARFELQPDLPAIEADEGQMSQLLGNLLVNARQATPGPGEVVVRARRRAVSRGEVPELAAGSYVEIAIEDHGHGIPADVLPRVFDPFFTTRPTGTGLGLASSYSIVRRHGGHVGITSREGEGTTVTVLLPAAASPPEEQAPVPPEPRAPGGLRVLVMDDDPLVLKVGLKHFRKLGIAADPAVDGAEAIEKFRRAWQEGNPYDVVMLDLTVTGGMGGAEALESLREIDPGVTAIACSGYFDAAVMAEPRRFGFAGVLAKPYLTADLERVLAAVARER
ncbi:MAG: CHASE domain-containing protein [Anaeromyxobacteraceae bacterium]